MLTKMNKVGIMTWYQHKNYGTMLQALALIEAVRKCGYDAFGINYVSEGYDRLTTLEKLCSIRKIKSGLRHIYQAKKYPLRKDSLKEERYCDFISKYIPMGAVTQTSSQLYSLNKECAAFICGSDQIWTPRAYNSKYFLDFVSDPMKKIAYAPSFGAEEIRDPYVSYEIGKQLATFQAISVRERQGAEMIETLYGLKAEVTLDPAMLLGAAEWKHYEKTAADTRDKIVCYFLGEDESTWKNVKKISAERQQDIAVIPVHNRDYYRGGCVLDGIGPAEFLYVLSHASMVCTDSFHGTIFSILNHKDFITFKRFSDKDPMSQNSRITSLLEKLCLEGHIWNGSCRAKETDWDEVDALLSAYRKDSMHFLKKALDTAARSKGAEKPVIVTNTCCGCGVCAKLCSRNAIRMELIQGFYQATVDTKACISCGICQKICAFNGEPGVDLKNTILYEAKSTDKNVLRQSTSGGISHEILTYLSRQQYPVFACIYDYNEGIVKHSLTEIFEGDKIGRYQGSKYLQSKFFNDELHILDMARGVIAGTPCQIAAADNYLRMKGRRGDFILIDLICHGVPSFDLWKTYLANEDIKLEEISSVKFRDSEKGWRERYIYIKSLHQTVSRREKDDLFYQFFDMQACYMKSCYECNFRTSSKADIRLGDYWGKKYTKDDLKYGVSMLSAFTQKGIDLLYSLKKAGKIYLTERPIEDYYRGQGPVNPIIPVYYSQLLDDLGKGNQNLRELIHKYCYMKYLNKKLQSQKANLSRIVQTAKRMLRGDR